MFFFLGKYFLKSSVDIFVFSGYIFIRDFELWLALWFAVLIAARLFSGHVRFVFDAASAATVIPTITIGDSDANC